MSSQKFVGVKFRTQGQIYYFETDIHDLWQGDQVIVSTEEGLGLGQVMLLRDEPPEELLYENIKPIQRKAVQEDFDQARENKALSKEAFAYCREQIRLLNLEMKLVDVEVRFDKSKIVFYFTAPSRIDFRELVKILVNKYRTRIELRQIGVRHEAQILGGIGNCGRVCCCHQFLRKFEPVTIKMAKEQQLFLNPSKISGTCGRLLCCLNFEKDIYSEFQNRCPKIGKKYDTPVGELKILRANLFRDSLIIGNQEGEESEITLLEWASLLVGKEEICSYEYLFKRSKTSLTMGKLANLNNGQQVNELEDKEGQLEFVGENSVVQEEGPDNENDKKDKSKNAKRKRKKESGVKKTRKRRTRQKKNKQS